MEPVWSLSQRVGLQQQFPKCMQACYLWFNQDQLVLLQFFLLPFRKDWRQHRCTRLYLTDSISIAITRLVHASYEYVPSSFIWRQPLFVSFFTTSNVFYWGTDISLLIYSTDAFFNCLFISFTIRASMMIGCFYVFAVFPYWFLFFVPSISLAGKGLQYF